MLGPIAGTLLLVLGPQSWYKSSTSEIGKLTESAIRLPSLRVRTTKTAQQSPFPQEDAAPALASRYPFDPSFTRRDLVALDCKRSIHMPSFLQVLQTTWHVESHPIHLKVPVIPNVFNTFGAPYPLDGVCISPHRWLQISGWTSNPLSSGWQGNHASSVRATRKPTLPCLIKGRAQSLAAGMLS